MARTVMGVNSQTSSVIDPADWVEYAAREHPRRLFLRTPAGRQLSYEALREQSARLASALMRRGVASGDRVAARVEKSAEAVLLYVACLRLGAVFVPINLACTANELDYLLCDSSPRLAVVPPGERDMLGPLADRAGIQCLETLGADGNGSLSELTRVCNSDCKALGSHDPGAPAAIVYTSRTTGRPKGAVPTRGSGGGHHPDRKSTRLNSSHPVISYSAFCLKKKPTLFCTCTLILAVFWQTPGSDLISIIRASTTNSFPPGFLNTSFLKRNSPAGTSLTFASV